MPQPVKLSDATASTGLSPSSAKAERSIAGQIEHWAALGRMVEPGGSRPPQCTPSSSGAKISLEQARPPAEEGAAILAALTMATEKSTVALIDPRASAAWRSLSREPLTRGSPAWSPIVVFPSAGPGSLEPKLHQHSSGRRRPAAAGASAMDGSAAPRLERAAEARAWRLGRGRRRRQHPAGEPGGPAADPDPEGPSGKKRSRWC